MSTLSYRKFHVTGKLDKTKHGDYSDHLNIENMNFNQSLNFGISNHKWKPSTPNVWSSAFSILTFVNK